jgi:hypothetical protein
MSEEIQDIAEESVVEEVITEQVAEDTTEVVAEATDAPLTEARTVSAINAELSALDKSDLDAILEAVKEKAKVETEDEDEEEEEDGDDEEGEVENEKKEGKKAKKESKKVSKKEDTFKEDLDVLVSAEDALSEGFRAKASTIFEAALHSKLARKTTELEERYASDLEGEVNAIKEDLVDKVDGYLNYVVENWIQENEVAVEHGLKSEITESFINSLHTVFTEHYINVPEDKVEIVDALTEEVTDAKDQLNTAQAANMQLAEKVKAFERADIITEACAGLAATEVAKLKELTESIDADNNEDYAAKVAVIKESYMNTKDGATEVVSEDIDAINEVAKEDTKMTGSMAKYLDAIKTHK